MDNKRSKEGAADRRNDKFEVLYGGRGTYGPITLRKVQARCRKCGNTSKFIGRAYVFPTIVIELQSDGSYDTTGVSYCADKDTDEKIERCAVCMSTDVEVKYQDEDFWQSIRKEIDGQELPRFSL